MLLNPARSARRKFFSRIFTGLCLLATVVALASLILILWSLITQGGSVLLSNFSDIILLDTPPPTGEGGLRNAIIGSLAMCAVAMVLAVVVGVLAGTWLAEIAGNSLYGQVVRFLNDVLLSAPSILIGLFVYQMMVVPMRGFSGWAGAVALAIVATPIVTRTTEDILNLQPHSLREAGMALGASRFFTIRRIIWKAAGAGLLTGGLLGFARISGETAPLMFTAANNQSLSADWWNIPAMMGSWTSSIPVVMYNFALSTSETWIGLAWAGALLIALAVLGVNIIGRYLVRDRLSK